MPSEERRRANLTIRALVSQATERDKNEGIINIITEENVGEAIMDGKNNTPEENRINRAPLKG